MIMDKQQFLREDWETYKPKFILCCIDCEFKVNKFAQIKDNEYIYKQIKITEI